MGISERFNKIFGVQNKLEDEKKAFVERVNQTIFNVIDTTCHDKFAYEELFGNICFELGKNANDFRERQFYMGSLDGSIHVKAKIRSLTKDNFEETLKVLCILYQIFETDDKNWLSFQIGQILERSTCDLGVKWSNDFFYPSGANELDESLIEDTLTWLQRFPAEKKDYKRALELYANKNFGDVAKNCYSALEGMARNILGNDKTLDSNKEALLKNAGLSQNWNAILANFINFLHDFRHASENRHDISSQETEAVLYMTGLLIRLIVESKMP